MKLEQTLKELHQLHRLKGVGGPKRVVLGSVLFFILSPKSRVPRQNLAIERGFHNVQSILRALLYSRFCSLVVAYRCEDSSLNLLCTPCGRKELDLEKAINYLVSLNARNCARSAVCTTYFRYVPGISYYQLCA